ncbi:MAG: chemotaxis protein CheX [Butyrivibrio sp.]|nr:chemotaxis protein CheX [Butyrivibrio sp.]
MFDRLIGNYLLEQGKLTNSQLQNVYMVQGSKRAKLGVIAVSEKLMTIAQAEEINSLQAVENKFFGEIAIEKGYLSQEQVERLLKLQGNEFLIFLQSIVDLNYLKMEDLELIIEEYRMKNGFPVSDIDALKNGEINRIIPIFVKTSDEKLLKMLEYGISEIFRLVDNHIYIGKAYTTTDFKSEELSYQKIYGDENATVAIFGKAEPLQKMAKSYTSEEFIETNEDALDAVCEIINCINGIYVTEASRAGKIIDLEPPEFITSYAEISGKEIYILPIYLPTGVINYAIILGSDVTIKQ